MEPEFLMAPPSLPPSLKKCESSKAPRDGAEGTHLAFCEIRFESPGDSVPQLHGPVFSLPRFPPCLSGWVREETLDVGYRPRTFALFV